MVCVDTKNTKIYQKIGYMTTNVLFLILAIVFLVVGIKFYYYSHQLVVQNYYLKYKITIVLWVISGLFTLRAVFYITKFFYNFDEKFAIDGWRKDDPIYGLYYSLFVLLFDLIPKIFILYSVKITITQIYGKAGIGKRKRYTSSRSYDSSIVRLSVTQEGSTEF
jgi:hypothetical protein